MSCEEVEIKSENVRVSYQEGVGRCLLASRDIKGGDLLCLDRHKNYSIYFILAGEEVLTDFPAMVAPYYDPQPMCLECLCK